MNDVLTLKNLSKAFGQTTVLRGVDLSLKPSDRLAVVGSSGSGKTTLLRMIAGLEPPTDGTISIQGQLVSQPGKIVVAPERREVAMVFQGLALFPHLRALDQIAFAARGRGGIGRAKELLDRIGLGHRSGAALDELSGGERQRIALARALAQEPRLILMDEPFASLDDEKRAEMRSLLRTLLDGIDATLILVTHSHDDALDLADRVLVLDHGLPVACDSLESVLARPNHAATVRCLGLGQMVEGEISDGGIADTVFGKVALEHPATTGRVTLLVRPGQPQLVMDDDGITAEVVSIGIRAPEVQTVRRTAVVRVGGRLLQVQIEDKPIAVGQTVRVRINGPCQLVEM